MTNPTTYFGWQMPTATDLVTDLPADFEVFGQAVDTDFQDLLGGTTGQVLSKTSGTDLDFTWINNDQGDITAVTAGTGISGGGTSGAVTITNSMATEIAAKADLIVGTGSATFDNLTVGANGTVLTADSTVSPTGLKWATPAIGGKVLQVVSANYSTQTSNSTSTAADTGLTATITPTLNTSKIYVIVSQNGVSKNAGNTDSAVLLRIVRTSTTLAEYDAIGYNGVSEVLLGLSCSLTFLDSPATTSATTYKTTFLNGGANAASVTVQRNSSVSTMTLLEIGA